MKAGIKKLNPNNLWVTSTDCNSSLREIPGTLLWRDQCSDGELKHWLQEGWEKATEFLYNANALFENTNTRGCCLWSLVPFITHTVLQEHPLSSQSWARFTGAQSQAGTCLTRRKTSSEPQRQGFMPGHSKTSTISIN